VPYQTVTLLMTLGFLNHTKSRRFLLVMARYIA